MNQTIKHLENGDFEVMKPYPKYNNKKKEYNGASYHSKLEASYAEMLDFRVKAGDVIKWDKQKKLSIDVNSFHICNYFIDFKVYLSDNSIEYVEVKGFETDTWRLKWRLTQSLFDELTISDNYSHIKLVLVKDIKKPKIVKEIYKNL